MKQPRKQYSVKLGKDNIEGLLALAKYKDSSINSIMNLALNTWIVAETQSIIDAGNREDYIKILQELRQEYDFT